MRKKSENEKFKYYYKQLKGLAFKTNDELAVKLGYKRGNSITEIIQGRQNIQPEKYKIFTEIYKEFISEVEGMGDEDIVSYKNKIIELQENALRDKQIIIDLQNKLLDKSSSANTGIKNDPVSG